MIRELLNLIKWCRHEVDLWAKSPSKLKQWGNHIVTASAHVVIVLVVSFVGLVLAGLTGWGPLFPLSVVGVVGFYFFNEWFNFIQYKLGIGGHYEHVIGWTLDWTLPVVTMFVLIGDWLVRLT